MKISHPLSPSQIMKYYQPSTKRKWSREFCGFKVARHRGTGEGSKLKNMKGIIGAGKCTRIGREQECRRVRTGVICDTERENKGQITRRTININYGTNVSEHAAFYTLSRVRKEGKSAPRTLTTAECH